MWEGAGRALRGRRDDADRARRRKAFGVARARVSAPRDEGKEAHTEERQRGATERSGGEERRDRQRGDRQTAA